MKGGFVSERPIPDEQSVDANASAVEVASTTIWRELEEWGKGLPDWQRFIVSPKPPDHSPPTRGLSEMYRVRWTEYEFSSQPST